MSSCKIHNVRFYNLEPKSVTSMSYEPTLKKLALARNDNSIEIWNIVNVPFIESTIVGQADNSIEALLWIGPRLFSCGFTGMIAEYDLQTLKIKKEVSVTGGTAWCMDVNHDKTRLAIGTEDGYINTFFITEESLLYEKIFDKQKGRILCMKWDVTGKLIFTGSADAVRVWNATTGNAIHKMITSRKEAKKETIVWCLAVTSENMIVSGDSRGILSVWDPNTGTLVESHESHTADILTVCLSNDMNTIYCAGVDPVIRTFSKVVVKSTGRTQWVRGIERRLHVHDVRTLLEAENKLYSAGVDGYLAYSSYPPKTLVKYPPLIQSPSVFVCKDSKCIMLRYHNYLELWKLGSYNNNDIVENGRLYNLDEVPTKLLLLKTKNDESILSAAISSNSKIIIYSTDCHVRVFNFNIYNGEPELSRMDNEITQKRIHKMIFNSDSKILATVNNEDNENVVTLYTVTKKCLRLHGSFKTRKESISQIGLISFSPDSKYLICSDFEGRIAIYNIDCDFQSKKIESWCLPKYSCPPTALSVQADTNNLVVVYSDHKIIEYSIAKRRYTDFSENLQSHLPTQWLVRPFPIINIMFDSNNENIILLHDDTTVFVINKNADFPNLNTKIAKLENGDLREDSSTGSGSLNQHTFKVIKKYKHLVHLAWLNNSEMVAVEVNPTSLIEKLPPTLKQKCFGI